MSRTEALPTMIRPRCRCGPAAPDPPPDPVPGICGRIATLVHRPRHAAEPRPLAEPARRPRQAATAAGGPATAYTSLAVLGLGWPGRCRASAGGRSGARPWRSRGPGLGGCFARGPSAPAGGPPCSGPRSDPHAPRSCSPSSRSAPPPNPDAEARSSFPATCCRKTLARSRPMGEVDEALRRAYARRGVPGLRLGRPSDAPLVRRNDDPRQTLLMTSLSRTLRGMGRSAVPPGLR